MEHGSVLCATNNRRSTADPTPEFTSPPLRAPLHVYPQQYRMRSTGKREFELIGVSKCMRFTRAHTMNPDLRRILALRLFHFPPRHPSLVTSFLSRAEPQCLYKLTGKSYCRSSKVNAENNRLSLVASFLCKLYPSSSPMDKTIARD